MAKWADYVISGVLYDSKHKIIKLKQHLDDGKTIGEGTIVSRITVISNIKNGKSYTTVFSGLASWKKGNKIRTFMLDGDYFIRVDQNKVTSDNLGTLPELEDKKEDYESPELEPKPEPKLEPQQIPQKPSGTLPKGFDLDSRPEVQEEATPEQIARLEHLEKQIADLEARKASPPPKPEVQEEATPEQIARLEQLEKQIADLETLQKLPIAYCVKCKAKRKVKDRIQTKLKNGRPAIKGKCFTCGTKVCRIIKISK